MATFRIPTPQVVRKKAVKFKNYLGSMTNKLVVIIISLKVPKIKKILLYEMNFLYQITAASRTPD